MIIHSIAWWVSVEGAQPTGQGFCEARWWVTALHRYGLWRGQHRMDRRAKPGGDGVHVARMCFHSSTQHQGWRMTLRSSALRAPTGLLRASGRGCRASAIGSAFYESLRPSQTVAQRKSRHPGGSG